MSDRFKFRAVIDNTIVYDGDKWAPAGETAYYEVRVSSRGIHYTRKMEEWDEAKVNGVIFYSDWESEQLIIPDIIEQCTGLKDKNGDLIYENDVLHGGSAPYNFNKHVHWNGRWYQLGTSDIILCEMEVESFGLTIIGNIHENGDLLK